MELVLSVRRMAVSKKKKDSAGEDPRSAAPLLPSFLRRSQSQRHVQHRRDSLSETGFSKTRPRSAMWSLSSVQSDTCSLASVKSDSSGSFSFLRRSIWRASSLSWTGGSSSPMEQRPLSRMSASSAHNARLTSTPRLASPLRTLEEEAPIARRDWIFKNMMDILSSKLPTSGGVVITGRPGTGKTIIIKALAGDNSGIDSRLARGLSQLVLASHFCKAWDETTCLPGQVACSLVAQLLSAHSMSALRQIVSEDRGLQAVLSRSNCLLRPEQALLALLSAVSETSARPYLVLAIDAVCQAEMHRTDAGQSVAAMLGSIAQKLPKWVKMVVTVQNECEALLDSLPYHRISLDDDGLDERLRKDVRDFVVARISSSPALEINSTPKAWKYSMTPCEALAEYMCDVAAGNFLLVSLVLDLLESGQLVLKAQGFNVLPQSLPEVFSLQMGVLFASSEAFAATRDIFNVCLASLRPLSLQQIFECVNALNGRFDSFQSFMSVYSKTSHLLTLDSDTDTLSFFHSSFRFWLASDHRLSCSATEGHAAIALGLSRRKSPLDARATLDLAHHVLKASLFSDGVDGLRVKHLRAAWLSTCSDALSLSMVSDDNTASLAINRLLLLSGADVNARTENNRTALSLACQRGDSELVALLLRHGATPTHQDDDGVTPLMMAAEHDDARIVRSLIEVQDQALLQMELRNHSGETAVGLAAKAGSANAVTAMVSFAFQKEDNAVISDLLQEALVKAASSNRVEVTQLLMRECDVNKKCRVTGALPLAAAVCSGAVNACSLLMENGADLSLVSDAIHLAAERGHEHMARFLTGRGLTVSAVDDEGHTPMARLLLSQLTPESARVSTARWLLDSWPELASQVDCAGRTALHYAAQNGQAVLARLLLDRGCPPEVGDKRGHRALEEAIRNGHDNVVSLLLKAGTAIKPTTWSTASDNTDILLLLLAKIEHDGDALAVAGRHRDSLRRFFLAAKRMPSSSDVTIRARVLVKLSAACLRCDRPVEAVDSATEAVALSPGCSEALRSLALAQAALGRHAEALECVRRAIRLDPTSAVLHQLAIRLQQREDQHIQ